VTTPRDEPTDAGRPDDRTDDPTRRDPPRHPDEQAALHERADGAHAEQLAGESTLRADETPPGVDPDEDDDA
jgi:hypothetical protein